MTPGSKDTPVRIKIVAAGLRELKKLTGAMAESFGLDRRIDAYQGKRPIQLYSWDLDCLIDVIDEALNDPHSSPRRRPSRFTALAVLHSRLKQLREEAYPSPK
ncbi:MAG: hypothetical protein HYZ53_26980 [Planctomycetes bacterium]|nr:hypothetical protein [Planctomycetota bacterium]